MKIVQTRSRSPGSRRLQRRWRGVSLVSICLLATLSVRAEELEIRHVTIVDVEDGSLQRDRTVRISDHRIVAISSVSDPVVDESVRIVDGSGGYLIPGLWDMHVHLFNNNADQPPNTFTFPLFLANGVTGVRDMWVKPGPAVDQVRAWRAELEAGTFVGPRIEAIGTLVDGDPPLQPGAQTVTTAEQARGFVEELAAAGIDFVKPYSNLSAEVYSVLSEAAKEKGLYVAGHGPDSVSSFRVSDSGQRSVEHLTGVHITCSSAEDEMRAGKDLYSQPRPFLDTFDPQKCQRLYARFVANQTWQVPTLITNRIWKRDATLASLRQDEGLIHTPVSEIREWEWVTSFLSFTRAEERQALEDLYRLEQRIVRDMYLAGVPLLAATDFGNPYIYPGFSLHDEMKELADAGLPALAVLQTATLNPARYLGRTDDFGTVAVGKLADLVLLDANPLDDIENSRRIRAVVMNGRLFEREQLKGLLRATVADNYRDVLAESAPLPSQSVEPAVMERVVGRYVKEGAESQAEITIVGETLEVSYENWRDRLEPLGGLTFRVLESNVLYLFQRDPDGAVWGFELNDGREVHTYRRVSTH